MKTQPTARHGLSALIIFATVAGSTGLHAQEGDAALREKVAALEKRITELEGKELSERKLEKLREENKAKARERAAQDRGRYSSEQLAEIETLYQVANRNWRTPEAKASLTELLGKFDEANRTGCATLYMGQMSQGRERLDYLTRAVEKFSDCYYLNGCQVGGYGRFVLALTLWESGRKDEARELLDELRTKYKDAIDHRGRPMSQVAEAAEKELGIAK